jgi:hypothetical protein
MFQDNLKKITIKQTFLLLCNHLVYLCIQGNLRVIMILRKFVMQPTIHVSHSVVVCVIIPHNDYY